MHYVIEPQDRYRLVKRRRMQEAMSASVMLLTSTVTVAENVSAIIFPTMPAISGCSSSSLSSRSDPLRVMLVIVLQRAAASSQRACPEISQALRASPDAGSLTYSVPGFAEKSTDPQAFRGGYRTCNPVLMRFNCPDPWSPFGAGRCLLPPASRQPPRSVRAYGHARMGEVTAALRSSP